MSGADGTTPMAAEGGDGASAPPHGGFPGPLWRGFSGTVRAINRTVGFLAGMMVVASCIIITNEVFWRYYLHRPHTWNLEVNVFLLIGAAFLAAGYTQMRRAHVGTEVLQTIMSARWNRRRILAGDILSALLCSLRGGDGAAI